jgi:hypothetical protein|tara:strand:+ start:573 stop:782 length:210 start_codon:yes stop_codon:yes gene_type:complete
MEQSNPEAEIVNVVNHITDGKRADAIDAIQDILYSRSADAIGTYKQVVAKSFFDEPVGDTPNETDNGTN